MESTISENCMQLTFEELKEKLAREEECTLLELLGVTSDVLVERFADEIEERQEELGEKLDD